MINRKYLRHPSILKIKNNFVSSITFEFPKAEVADINALLKQTDPKNQLDLKLDTIFR